ncbi:hypothetical protein LTR37_011545 [Vermiconidia calcicola]|uniref:Uncharacterized protein n=1 Tax=Vermiconidia calcicola TaxID=1690605 RepID=A0ACC3N2N1_9PEZI|nr:hypothetical protein LTR37_011545 [Vermiconidia calcicola]
MAGSAEVFDFFALSLEIRDMIYDELLDFEKNLGIRNATVTVRSMPRIEHSLVSRQFNSELGDRAKRSSMLLVEDRFDPGRIRLELQLHAGLRPLRCLQLKLYLDCEQNHQDEVCGVDEESARHYRWITSLTAQMPHLRSLSLELHLGQTSVEKNCHQTLLACQSRFTALQHLTSCDVYLIDEDYLQGKCDVGKQLMAWSNKTGKLQSIGTAELGKGH